MKFKYIITLWQNFYDFEGLTCDFSIEGTFDDLANAKSVIPDLSRKEIDKQLSENKGWGLMNVGGKKQVLFSDGVNKNNKVVHSHQFKTGDGSGYNSIYSYYEVIEIPQDAEVNKELFNMDSCEWEVKSYFDKEST